MCVIQIHWNNEKLCIVDMVVHVWWHWFGLVLIPQADKQRMQMEKDAQEKMKKAREDVRSSFKDNHNIYNGLNVPGNLAKSHLISQIERPFATWWKPQREREKIIFPYHVGLYLPDFTFSSASYLELRSYISVCKGEIRMRCLSQRHNQWCKERCIFWEGNPQWLTIFMYKRKINCPPNTVCKFPEEEPPSFPTIPTHGHNKIEWSDSITCNPVITSLLS